MLPRSAFRPLLRALTILPTACLVLWLAGCGGEQRPAAERDVRTGADAPPAAPAREGIRSEHDFAYPDFRRHTIVSATDGLDVSVALRPDGSHEADQVWVLAVPPGDFEVVHRAVHLLDARHGEVRTIDNADELESLTTTRPFPSAFAVEDLGVFRRVRLLAVRLNVEVPLRVNGTNYTLNGADFALTFPQWQEHDIADTGFTDVASPLRRVLDKTVANAEALDLYAQPDPEEWTRAGRDVGAWQPRPELSPDFPWLKIPVESDGLYSIDGRWLTDAGLDPRAIDPDRLQLVSEGGEIAMLRTGLARAGFAAGARLLFFAYASDSPETRARIYYLGKRPEGETPTLPEAEAPAEVEPTILTHYERTVRIEEDNILRTRLGSFLSVREMTWVWGELPPREAASFPFRTEGLARPVPAAQARLHYYSGGRTPPPGTTLRIAINGTEIHRGVSFPSRGEPIEFEIPEGVLRHDGNTLELTYNINVSPTHRTMTPMYLEALELTYRSLVGSENGRHEMVLEPGAVEGPVEIEAVGFRANRVLALDLSVPGSPTLLPVQADGGVARISASLGEEGARILLHEEDLVDRAPVPVPSVWRDWSGTDWSADVVIVHHADFARHAEELAEQIAVTGRETIVADVESIYEAFTDGELSASAIRHFASHAMRAWEGRRPHTLLLIGDATSDGRNIARNNVRNFVPTFSVPKEWGRMPDEYSSDAFFGWIAGEDELTDMIVGRLSVANEPDADEVLAKITDYRSWRPGEWTGRHVTVTDPGEFAEAARRVHRERAGAWLDHRIINTAEFPWEDNFYLPPDVLEGDEVKVSPLVTSAINDAFNEGAAIVSFFGHGSPNIWSNQRIWFGGDSPNSDNLRLENRQRLPFLVAYTCNNAAIDYPVEPWNICITEDMMRVPNGGIIGGFLPTGPGFTRNHREVAKGFHTAIGPLGAREFGVVAELARLHYQAVMGSDDHSRMYLLLGDPTLELLLPEPEIEIETELRPWDGTSKFRTLLVRARNTTAENAEAILREDGGPVLVDAILKRDENGVLRGALPVPVQPRGDEWNLVVRASGSDGTMRQGGHVVRLHDPLPAIEAFRWEEKPDGRRGGAFEISHDAPGTEVETTFHTVRVAATGEEPVVESASIVIPPTGTLFRTVDWSDATPDEPRIAFLHAWVGDSPTRSARTDYPSTEGLEAFVEGSVDPDAPPNLVLAGFRADSERPAFRIVPARGRASQPQAEIFAANLGGGTPQGVLHWRIVYPDGHEVEGQRQIGSVASGRVVRTLVPMRMELDMTTEFTVEVYGELVQRNEEDDDIEPERTNTLAVTLRSEMLPNLRVVEDSIRVSPDHLAEGLTVFVEGEVENAGAQPSWPVRAALFAADDDTQRNALRSLAGQPRDRLPGLLPGERTTFRLRWDPLDNRRAEAIQLLVDSEKSLVESDKAGNVVHVPVEIKSTWRLQPERIVVRRGRPGTLVLTAIFSNVGETDAQRVSVFFFADSEQSEENRLGEVLVERVRAGETLEVPFEWDLAGWDPDVERNPSFTLALKGSLQRVSSVADGGGQ